MTIKAYPGELLTAKESAEKLGISRQRFRKLCSHYKTKPWYEHKQFLLFHIRDIELLKIQLDCRPPRQGLPRA